MEIKELESIIKEDEIEIYFQLHRNLENERIVGAECLSRRVLKTGEIQAPDKFIPYFEKYGMIVEYDEYILKKVCKHIKEINRADLKFFVNLSGKTFMDSKIIDKIILDIMESKINLNSIGIELTETINLEDKDQINVSKNIKKFVDMGIVVAMDDFGQGSATLEMLRKCPVQIIKIDRSFIKNKDEKSDKLLKALLTMCNFLELTTVAEGIET